MTAARPNPRTRRAAVTQGEGKSMGKAKTQRRRRPQPADRYDISDYEAPVIEPREDDSEPDEVQMIHAFTADGTEYYAPMSVPFSVALEASEVLATQGEAAAIRFQLASLFGEDGYAALLKAKPDRDTYIKIVTLTNKIIMGSIGDSNLGKS